MHFQSCNNTFQKSDSKSATNSKSKTTEQKYRWLETALFEMPSLKNHKIWRKNFRQSFAFRLSFSIQKSNFWNRFRYGLGCSFNFLIDFTQIMLCWTWSHRRGIWRFLSLFSIRHTEFILRYGYPNPYFGLKWLSNYFHCHYLLFSGANVSTISYIQSKSRQARWKWTNNGYFLFRF